MCHPRHVKCLYTHYAADLHNEHYDNNIMVLWGVAPLEELEPSKAYLKYLNLLLSY